MFVSAENRQTQEVLAGFFDGTSRNDIPTIAQYLAEEIDFYIAASPYMPWTGQKSSKQEVIKALRQLMDAHMLAEDDFEMEHTFIDGNEAAVFGKAGRTVKATGKKFKAHFVMRFTIAEGLITKFRMLEDSHEIEQAFITD
ncbi:nuclear transport factor 2 family protein [Chitinophaga sp. Cy-1792]|uniref:nuclear transport factor 2 family protein n=1 Tax=Chitinophaga sp. Cy-1792 TaxID=2608339 RepID=UPI001424061F|nr:nuclear transport factor 2 family protein [Chitinophaga sp. Cy-1792]NIG54539.1 nuclear transport factor 2 family protein [Chitinophaga sp. Cy-1792]